MESNCKNMLMFTCGKKVYSEYNKKYKKHKKGYVILGPPGIGKTTFIKKQTGKKKDWIDQDDLFCDLGVKWCKNKNNQKDFKLNYLRADYMSEQSKNLGYRIIGALYWNYIPDAIVIITPSLHKKYLKNRKLDVKKVNIIKNDLKEMAKEHNIPLFSSIQKAVDFLENK